MAKYRKAGSGSRSKRKKIEAVPVVVEAGRSYVDQLIRTRIQQELQEALEAERDELVGRAWHRHHADGSQKQYRNGYAAPRALTCGCGTVRVQIPRLRQPYASKIVGKYDRLTPEVQQLIPQLYLHGLSLGDFDQAYGWLWGQEAPLSEGSVVRLKSSWEQQYQEWKKQPLEREYLYVWADGIYPKGGAIDETLAVLVVVGVDRQGRKHLLALEEGYRESEESWASVLRGLRARGVRWIGLMIGDGIAGLWKALRGTFPMAAHQRCWVHKMRNVLDRVPNKAHDEVLDALREIYRARSYDEALKLRAAFIRQYQRAYPKAVESLLEAGDSLLTYLRFPKQHWVHLKTTNPIESLFSTVRLRTRAARRLRTRMGAVCLIFQLLRTSETRLRAIRAAHLVTGTIDALQAKQSKIRTAA
jgi:transposase-like protein